LIVFIDEVDKSPRSTDPGQDDLPDSEQLAAAKLARRRELPHA
jgi:hypothetical protein